VLPGIRQFIGRRRRQRDLRHQLEVLAQQDLRGVLQQPDLLLAVRGRVVLRQERVDAADPLHDIVLEGRYRIAQLPAEARDLGIVVADAEVLGIERRERQRCLRIRDHRRQGRASDVDELLQGIALDDERITSAVQGKAISGRGRRRRLGQLGADDDLGIAQE
jgi:hypothetical protein